MPSRETPRDLRNVLTGAHGPNASRPGVSRSVTCRSLRRVTVRVPRDVVGHVLPHSALPAHPLGPLSAKPKAPGATPAVRARRYSVGRPTFNRVPVATPVPAERGPVRSGLAAVLPFRR